MATSYLIKVKSIKVVENGVLEVEGERVKVNNGLILTLYYPNVGKPSVVSTRKLKLQDNIPFDFTREPWQAQVVFKEDILDEAYLEIELTSIEKATKIAKLFHKVFSSVATTATSLLPGGSIVTGASKKATESLFELIEPKDKVAIIGRFGGTMAESFGTQTTILPFTVPKDIKIKKRTTDGQGRVLFIEKTLRTGFLNGQIELDVVKL